MFLATSSGPVGFIGLGNMGASMAKNLLKNNYKVIVCDVNKNAVKDLESSGMLTNSFLMYFVPALCLLLGAKTAQTPAEIASQSTRIVTMLPSSPQVLEVYAGKTGILRFLNSLFPQHR